MSYRARVNKPTGALWALVAVVDLVLLRMAVGALLLALLAGAVLFARGAAPQRQRQWTDRRGAKRPTRGTSRETYRASDAAAVRAVR